MPDIYHDFPIFVAPERVFGGVSTPAGLDLWWTKTSSGSPREGSEYDLFFGPEYDWRAKVTESVPNKTFELEFTNAMDEWTGSRVRFDLAPITGGTQLRFRHTGWPAETEHYRISCYCWAMYLRILKRNLEHGETVPYEKRLDV